VTICIHREDQKGAKRKGGDIELGRVSRGGGGDQSEKTPLKGLESEDEAISLGITPGVLSERDHAVGKGELIAVQLGKGKDEV